MSGKFPDDFGEEQSPHPSFATVTVGRVQGRKHLFGSEADHHHFIRVAVQPATVRRNLSNDYIFGAATPMIEFDMSESQWAHFISSHSLGGGTPCTLAWLNGKQMPEIPAPETTGDKFGKDMLEHLQQVMEHIGTLRKMVATAQEPTSPRKKDLAAIGFELSMLEQSIRSNLPFVADQFAEKVEEVMISARQEIESYFLNRTIALGLDAALEQAPLSLPKPQEFGPGSVGETEYLREPHG